MIFDPSLCLNQGDSVPGELGPQGLAGFPGRKVTRFIFSYKVPSESCVLCIFLLYLGCNRHSRWERITWITCKSTPVYVKYIFWYLDQQ